MKNCCYKLSSLDPVCVYKNRLALHREGRVVFNQYILDLLDYAYDLKNDSFSIRVDNIRVCESCFCLRVGFSKRTFEYRKANIRQGQRNFVHGNKGAERPNSEKGNYWRAAMKEYFSLAGDKHPKSGDILLSPIARSDIYEEIKIDIVNLGKPIISLSWFNCVWRLEFPYVKIPPKLRLGLCDKCVDYKDQLTVIKDVGERIIIKQSRRQHIIEVGQQKQSYYSRRLLAEKNRQVFVYNN